MLLIYSSTLIVISEFLSTICESIFAQKSFYEAFSNVSLIPFDLYEDCVQCLKKLKLLLLLLLMLIESVVQ